MMRKSILVAGIALVSVAAVLPAWTQEAGEVEKTAGAEAVPPPEKTEEAGALPQEQRQAIIANISALQNMEARVSVLQQILNEELAKLRQMEAVFCDQYDLDPQKYRARKYEYNAATGKFSEKKE